jgi:hypothetical protein
VKTPRLVAPDKAASLRYWQNRVLSSSSAQYWTFVSPCWGYAEILTNAIYAASTETVPKSWQEKSEANCTRQADLSSETCDQRIIANPLITLHSPQTTTLRQIPQHWNFIVIGNQRLLVLAGGH